MTGKNGVAASLLTDFFGRAFCLVALSCTVLIVAIPALMYFDDIRTYKKDSVEQIQRFIETELSFDLGLLLTDKQIASGMAQKIRTVMHTSNMVEFKIWNAEGVNLYSFSDPSMIGDKFPDNTDLLETIASGRASAEVEEPLEAENINLGIKEKKLFEVYVPVKRQGRIVGAVEVYRVAPSYSLLGLHTFIVPLVAIAMFVLLYLFLYGNIRKAVGRLVSYDKQLESAYGSLGRSYFDTIRSLVKALELRDMDTEGHSERVVSLSILLARQLGLDEQSYGTLVLGSYLHDIGKIGVPDEILQKQGRLTDDEREVIKEHVQKGYEIIRDVEILKEAKDVVLGHHEKWDGSGYPGGLDQNRIPITARIFALVDVFDALMNKRPYKTALPYETSRMIINAESGIHFDPDVVDAFNALSKEDIMAIMQEAQHRKVSETINNALEKLISVNNLENR